ncbi:MAG: hypothetical protein WA447_05755 [Candidatus Binatus sp.]
MGAMTDRKILGLRHASALAVLGWFLVAPPAPTHRGGKAFVDTNAALLEWEGIGSRFNSINDCEKAKQNLQTKWRDEEERTLEGAAEMDANPSYQAATAFEAARLTKCVSWDEWRASEETVRSRR